jgi:predicted nucleic-acid-binding protein
MTIIADTNLLVRLATRDNETQARIAEEELRQASAVAIGNVALCELVWVLRALYKRPSASIAATIRVLVDSDNVTCDRNAVAASLAMLDSGGDFADGVIAYEGRALGGTTFVSFDKSASGMLKRAGVSVRVLG